MTREDKHAATLVFEKIVKGSVGAYALYYAYRGDSSVCVWVVAVLMLGHIFGNMLAGEAEDILLKAYGEKPWRKTRLDKPTS